MSSLSLSGDRILVADHGRRARQRGDIADRLVGGGLLIRGCIVGVGRKRRRRLRRLSRANCIRGGATSRVRGRSALEGAGIAGRLDMPQSAKKPASQIAVESRCDVTMKPARVRAKMRGRRISGLPDEPCVNSACGLGRKQSSEGEKCTRPGLSVTQRYAGKLLRAKRGKPLTARAFPHKKYPAKKLRGVSLREEPIQLTRFQVWPPQNRPPKAQPWTFRMFGPFIAIVES